MAVMWQEDVDLLERMHEASERLRHWERIESCATGGLLRRLAPKRVAQAKADLESLREQAPKVVFPDLEGWAPGEIVEVMGK